MTFRWGAATLGRINALLADSSTNTPGAEEVLAPIIILLGPGISPLVLKVTPATDPVSLKGS
ncbi:hypothetical protein EGI16_04900 [Chryseobacterium sp. G0240]|nr:hypothetical protein EGI16_04900 [Chryseobacterium sp. G0240]